VRLLLAGFLAPRNAHWAGASDKKGARWMCANAKRIVLQCEYAIRIRRFATCSEKTMLSPFNSDRLRCIVGTVSKLKPEHRSRLALFLH
jgi:hypothetical protein